ncbi:MAG: GNAT family N-acetyltransferase [Chloroflexota bacterium]
MEITIQKERPDSPEAVKLIDELENVLGALYNAENRFGYSVQKLIDQGVHFYVARADRHPAGCGGVQIFPDASPPYAELKRMYTHPDFRGMGIAKKMLEQLKQIALDHDVTVLRLETGIYQHEAIGLYKQWGFEERGPFGDYTGLEVNLYFEKTLSP